MLANSSMKSLSSSRRARSTTIGTGLAGSVRRTKSAASSGANRVASGGESRVRAWRDVPPIVVVRAVEPSSLVLACICGL